MTVYHIPTVYLILGILYLILPLTVWVLLFNQPSRALTLWCSGGLLFGVALALVGLRSHLPAWLTYTVANGLMWSAALTQALALRRALEQDLALKRVALLILIGLLGFEYFRVVLQNPVLRFSWSTLIFTALFSYISYLSWRIAVVNQLKSAKWLSVVYAITAITMVARTTMVLFGFTEPDVVASGVDSVLTVFTGLLISILGNFAFVGMFLERSTQERMKAIAQRARQEESARLGDQIAQLERQRTLGTMSASFAHELSQPLTAILMDVQAIKISVASGESNSKEVLELIEEIENSTQRTVQLVERIRNFIRPAQTDYELVDLKALLEDVAQLLAYEIRKQKIKFEFDVDAVPCWVHGDRVQLSQIVLNVYRNAMQAMEPNASRKIFVSLENSDERVVLRVRDTGPGVSAEMKQVVGEPFVTSKKDGLGVGLSISKTIAEMHNGSLTISNAVDGGAIVELNLPTTRP
jgi:C4-dicarboxylate-specific signal transduction histidine kinase